MAASATSLDSMAGDLQGIGSFRLHGALGSGPTATVYRATREQDAALERAYAVKVLHDGAQEAASRQRARWRVGLRLAAPHVLSPLEVGRADGRPFAVYPLVEGCDARRLAQRGGLDAGAAAVVVRGALTALVAGLNARPRQCHGALDAGDVLIDQHGEVFVTGFGVKAAVAAEDADLRAVAQLARQLCDAWPPRAETWLRDLETLRGPGAEAHRALESFPLEGSRPALEALARAVEEARQAPQPPQTAVPTPAAEAGRGDEAHPPQETGAGEEHQAPRTARPSGTGAPAEPAAEPDEPPEAETEALPEPETDELPGPETDALPDTSKDPDVIQPTEAPAVPPWWTRLQEPKVVAWAAGVILLLGAVVEILTHTTS